MWRCDGFFAAHVVLATTAGVLPAVTARAQTPAPLRLELPTRLSLPPLYPSERLRLTFPIVPLRFSFSEVRPIGLGAALGPTAHFTSEAVWFESGALSFRTRTESLEAVGLECTGLTCTPTTEQSITGEARLGLGSFAASRVVPEAYVYARYKHFVSPTRDLPKQQPGRFQLGIGGLLDL